jgi:hypothetical protein
MVPPNRVAVKPPLSMGDWTVRRAAGEAERGTLEKF